MNDAEQMRAEFERAFPGSNYAAEGGGIRTKYFDVWIGFRAGYEAAIAACAALGWKTAEVAK